MRTVNVKEITNAICKLAQETNFFLTDDVKERIAKCRSGESIPRAEEILSKIEENIKKTSPTEYEFFSKEEIAALDIEELIYH